jgi:hypothetical protein
LSDTTPASRYNNKVPLIKSLQPLTFEPAALPVPGTDYKVDKVRQLLRCNATKVDKVDSL